MEAWLARAARLRPDGAAVVAGGGVLEYGALLAQAAAVGGFLVERGVAPGDRVALAMPSEELVVALHACLLVGAVAVPVDLRLQEAERAARVRGAALVLDGVSGLSSGAVVEARPVDLAAVATLMFTSGTTAGPKPVALTYGNWLWNALGSALALGFDPEERWLCPMPLAHVGGLSIQLRSVIYGTTVVLHDRFEVERALAALMDPAQRVTLVSLVPTMLARLLDAGLREPPTLRRVLLGGGPISTALLARAREAGVAVSPSYGMTETCSQIVTDGVPLLGAEVRLDAGAAGPSARSSSSTSSSAACSSSTSSSAACSSSTSSSEILVRGPAVSAGALAADGWLHTGDLGAFDEGGRLQVVGRLADTIVTGGENVAPAEVEAVLAEHPAVADAAVLGRPDPEWGEAVVAQVVPAPGCAVVAEELRAHCAARLAGFKVPKRFEEVASLPRGATGKLLRRELA